MRFLYALALCAFVSLPASAQVNQVEGELVISGLPDLNTVINNDQGPMDLPPIYTPPDTMGGVQFFGNTLFSFEQINGTDTTQVGTGAVYTTPGLTAPLSVAITATGELARGCTAANPGSGNTPAETDIVNDLTGTIAIVSRGVCSFSYKVLNARAAGAVGVIIANVEGGVPAGGFNLGSAVDFTLDLSDTPTTLIPFGIANPIVEEIIFIGTPLTATIRAFQDPVAAENGPATTESGLELSGANPFSTSTELRLFSENAEAVRVELFNVRGQLIATLFSGTVVGERAVTVSSANVAPGVYFVRATGETFRKQVQVTIVR